MTTEFPRLVTYQVTDQHGTLLYQFDSQRAEREQQRAREIIAAELQARPDRRVIRG